jgi:DeoR family fructose operon transcriptional repressor
VTERTWFADERYTEVLRLLDEAGRVESASLTNRFGISAESVRKDLALLETRGLLRRVHGGAIPREPSRAEPHVAERGERMAEKSAIATRALGFVPEGASLLLDAGTTTLRLAEILPTNAELVVYTNAMPIAAALHRRGIDVVTLGGRVRTPTMAGVGGLTAQALAAINVDVAFLGTNALSFDRGLTTPDPEEAAVKQQMLTAARQRVFLVDSGKFGHESLARHATLADVDVLITDAASSEEHRTRLRAAGVAVEVAEQ